MRELAGSERITPEVLEAMRARVEWVDAAVAAREKYEPGTEEYHLANLAVCRAIGDSHWIVAKHWRALIACAAVEPAPDGQMRQR